MGFLLLWFLAGLVCSILFVVADYHYAQMVHARNENTTIEFNWIAVPVNLLLWPVILILRIYVLYKYHD